ncbi:MAG: DeoR/GlpR family DNA-binding transcription regulator [Pseudomonadota bacterium]
MEPIPPRQSDILDLARQRGRVEVDGLADHFGVTPQTIRKDLNDLCDRDLLQRVHGGAVYPSTITNYAYESRRVIAANEKQRIAERAADLIPDNSSIILNIGTTTEQVAMALKRHAGLMVITNNIHVAHILSDAPNAIEVVVAGGLLRKSDGGIVGEATVDFMRQFRVDVAVIGASAIDADGTILDYDFREVRISREIIAHARQTMLVADVTKFDRSAPVRIANLADISTFVTDHAPPPDIVKLCADNEVRLEIAGIPAQAVA